ncbi:30S ribosomal protein S5 [bacterium]|nr:30S ribosomal protein S5 [bacterium]
MAIGSVQTKKEEEFEEAVLEIRRVTKVTEGGKKLKFRAAVVVGDRKGRVGFGVSKASEVPQAVEKARQRAIKQMIEIPLVEDTIPFEIEVKFKSARVFLKPAAPGTGLRVGRLIRPLIELAGIRNILSKVKGSSDKIANAYAVMKAFEELNLWYKHLQERLKSKKTQKTKKKTK